MYIQYNEWHVCRKLMSDMDYAVLNEWHDWITSNANTGLDLIGTWQGHCAFANTRSVVWKNPLYTANITAECANNKHMHYLFLDILNFLVFNSRQYLEYEARIGGYFFKQPVKLSVS